MNARNPSSLPEPAGEPGATERGESAAETLADLAGLLDRYLAELEAGRNPDRAKLLADHPLLATHLAQALEGLEFVHRTAAGATTAPSRLGDFRIVREVGRGGMGVVYEAEQVSLRRRVALKILRFGAVADEVAMQRFQREAETVARLHHTNIVPIFAVGCENGAHYYAMQFIEGRDLAELLAAARSGRESIAPESAARWGLQAAEAVAHAHAHGVIHRDIKPSNLIRDGDGRIWLTDFGLARRADDVALSLTGALLGTPRYMSPEQARASKDPIDHRTDIYSLGATLYELATGRPIFDATTAHEVLSQILHVEPRAPRQIAPALPRDFETIILKCLAKEPAQRYPTAQALVDDLRALLEGRAISARRASAPERVVRWARKHRRTTTVAAFSAGVSFVLAAGGYLLWQDRQQARLGRLSLTTESPNLLAEVVDTDGRPLSPAFPVPTPEPVAVPAGAHGLRLSASGLLSEDWPIDVTPRGAQTHLVQLPPRWLWPPGEVNIAENPETQVVNLGSRADLLVVVHAATGPVGAGVVHRLRCLDGSTGKPAWPGDLVFDETSLPPGRNLDEWRALLAPAGLPFKSPDHGASDRQPDLDGDGVGDPVLFSRTTPSLVAVSGASGRVLWWARTRPTPGATGAPPSPAAPGMTLEHSGRGFVVGSPAVADVDADGTADFVACFHSDGDTYAAADRALQRTGPQDWLGAISGRTGAVLWQARSEESWGGYLNSSLDYGKYDPLCRPVVARVKGQLVVVLLEKASLRGFDARTGRPAWPAVPLGFEPDRAPDLVDLDGDGGSEALFLRLRDQPDGSPPRPPWLGKSGFGEEATLGLVAVSLPEGVARWEKPFSVVPKWQARELEDPRRHFHTVADLDADGRPEVILSGGWRSLRGGTRLGFSVLDGRTGGERWHRLVWAQHFFGGVWNVDHFIVGPDLDGDRQRELFAAWEGYDDATRRHGLFVVAISGATGAMLWRVHQPNTGTPLSLTWWHAGPDGWPLLLVSADRAPGGSARTLVLAGGSGRLEHTLPDIHNARVADFDGDGITDLFYTVAPQGVPRNLVIKGTVPDAWRQLGDWRAAADFNADGFTDFIAIADGVLTARSGHDGRVMWRAAKGPRDLPMESPQPAGDFNGDGVADVLAVVDVWRAAGPQAFSTKRLVAGFSGKDGRQLWTAEQLDILGGSASMSGPNWSCHWPLLDWADLDQDGRAELLASYVQPGGPPRVAAVSGQDGHVLWAVPTTRGAFALKPSPTGRALADFNGDRVLDLALWLAVGSSPSEQGPLELNVVDGRTGQRLWPPSAVTVSHPERLIWPEPALADLDGDGRPEVLVTRHGGYDQRESAYRGELIAADGRDGQVRWTWTWQSGLPRLWPPLAIRSGTAGQATLGIVVQTNGVPTLVTLDSSGQERVRRPLKLPGRQFDFGQRVWTSTDLDGDGREEVVFLDDGQLCVAGGDALDVRWRWRLPSEETCLADVRRPGQGLPATLTVWSGRDAYGLDGVTGQPHWRTGVAGPPGAGGSDPPEVYRLSAPRPRLQHLVTTRSGFSPATAIRDVWPVAANGLYMMPAPTNRTYAPLRQMALPRRPLPWADSDAALVLSGAVTLLLAGIPVLLVGWAIRRRSWLVGLLSLCYAGLSLWLPWRGLVPAAVAMGYALWLGGWAGKARRWQVLAVAIVYAGLALAVGYGSTAAAPSPGGPVWFRTLEMTVVGTPALAFWTMCGGAIARRRWGALAMLLAGSLLLAVLAAVPALVSDSADLGPDEAYEWRGAYAVWFVGVSLTGLIALVIVGGKWLFRRLRDWRAAAAPTPAAA